MTAVASPTATPASPPLANPTVTTPSATREFEKAAVTQVITKISGASGIDSLEQEISIDDMVRVVGEFRVVKVSHEVQKDGSVARVQYVKPAGDLVLVPWDPSDPTDNGIVRARP